MSDELITGTFSSGSTGQRVTGALRWDPNLDPPDVKMFKLILDVLRANRLHQDACAHRQAVEENAQGMWHVEVPPCNCWLADAPPRSDT